MFVDMEGGGYCKIVEGIIDLIFILYLRVLD